MLLEDIEANYASMAELARANNIRVIFSSVLPVNDYTPKAAELFYGREPEKILKLNQWMKDFCATGGCVYLDYFSALADAKGLMKQELALDGLHPNETGYRVMAPLAEKAIAQALGTAPAH
jgi:lysophospholipase L1-like esterase